MKIETFFDSATSTFTYVVSDCETKKCAVIDSVLDYDIFSGKVFTRSADLVIDYICEHSLSVEWILETHIHADHLTASSYIKNKLGGKAAVGIGFLKVLDMWVQRFNTKNDTSIKGDQFDVLLKEGDQFFIGSLKVDVWQTPGHTPACLSYLIGDNIFVGDNHIWGQRVVIFQVDLLKICTNRYKKFIHCLIIQKFIYVTIIHNKGMRRFP